MIGILITGLAVQVTVLVGLGWLIRRDIRGRR